MNAPSILNFLDRVLDAAKAASPVATLLGVPFVEQFTSWADAAVELAQNAVARAGEAEVVLSSNDVADINSKIAQIQSINDQIAANIAAS